MDQGTRGRIALTEGRRVELHDERGRSLRLDLSDVDQVFTIAVTLDDLSSVAPVIWQLAQSEVLPDGVELPWLVSLHELEIVCDLLDYAVQLPHFLSRRTRLNELGRVEASDELDLFMCYLKRGLYFDDVLQSEGSVDRLGLLSFTDELDAYFFYRQGYRSMPAEKPRQLMDPSFEELIGFLDRERPPGFLTAACKLLDVGDPERAEIASALGDVAMRADTSRLFERQAYRWSDAGGEAIALVGGPPGKADHLTEVLKNYVVLNAQRLPARRVVGLGAVAGRPEPLQSLVTLVARQ